MDWKLELLPIPVTDVDRAKAFYVEKAGFIADHDHAVSDEIRFVQLTPPGSACSIALGLGISDAPPGQRAGAAGGLGHRGRARRARVARRRRQRRAGLPVGQVRVLRRSRRQSLVGPAGQPASGRVAQGRNASSTAWAGVAARSVPSIAGPSSTTTRRPNRQARAISESVP